MAQIRTNPPWEGALIIGVLGAGRVGQRHIKNACALGHKVIWFDPESIHLPYIKDGLFEDRHEIFRRADIIISATPTKQHLADLTDAVDARKPILVEKPIASIGQARALSSLLDKTSAPVATGFNLRFHPQTHQLKTVDNPYYASLICAQYTDTPADGVLNHWASHEIDLAQYVLGPLHLLDMHVLDQYCDLCLTGKITGAIASIYSDMIARDHFRRALVIGKHGWAEVNFNENPVTNQDYIDELEAFVGWVESGERPEQLAVGWDGYEVLKICERASTLNVQRDPS